ncbi:MAG TPA: MFS transporter [Thermoanaerobaculia bacterium]|nr:MFS transporter [Thermoanaerobaculia bacterium]
MTANNSRLPIPALAVILYFSQGFPFGIVNETVNLYLSFSNVDLATIGLAGGVGLAWTLKFFWAPLIDAVGSYRTWIFGTLIVISLMLAALGVAPLASGAFAAVLIVLAVASATQDIAVDALAIRITPPERLGAVNSARVAAYRCAMIVAGGGVAIVADRVGWRSAFFIAAAVPLIVLALVAFTVSNEGGARTQHQNPLRGLWRWLQKPQALLLLAVILLYRLGDNALTQMIRPYWSARGFSAAEAGNVTITLGMICTIAGAIAGGAFVTRFGVYRGLLVLGIVQMLSNLTYAMVAMTEAGRPAMYGAAIVETFCGGLGTAALMSFLMAICDRDNAATEYSMFSALFGLGRTLAFTLSGYVAKDLGFTRYYLLTVALAIPALLLVPLIRERVTNAVVHEPLAD